MTPIALHELARILEASGPQLPHDKVSRVSTDTRNIRPGDVFIALAGDRFDAHDFLDQATDAAVAVVERVPANAPPGLPLLVVQDTRRALGDLARWHRQTLQGRVIAVAGSNGKTGTKLLIDGVLRTTLHGSASPKSFNNDIGVPLTLLDADADQDYVIVECGTNHPGEIARLAEIAQPNVVVVTSIGHEHLEGLGDLNGVRRENANVFNGFDHPIDAIVCGDDLPFVRLAMRKAPSLTTFGTTITNDLVAQEIEIDVTGTTFRCGTRRWSVPQLGRHAASNALAAVAVGRLFGIGDDAIADGLATADVPAMRLNIRRLPRGVVVLDDCYNANPESMRAALDLLASLPTAGRRVAILGDMLELGPTSAALHVDAAEHAAMSADLVACVGPKMTSAAGASMPTFADADAAAAWAIDRVSPGDLVLLKASRGIGLEAVAERLDTESTRQEAAVAA